MKCPFCQHSESKVIDSRVSTEADMIRRRRECDACNQRFTTYERVEDVLPMVIKKDQRREVFDDLKILNGVKKACEKRPISLEKMNSVVSLVAKKVQEKDLKEIPAADIGLIVMEQLKELDDVAYVRFASVYRSFKDINEFIFELQGLLKK